MFVLEESRNNLLMVNQHLSRTICSTQWTRSSLATDLHPCTKSIIKVSLAIFKFLAPILHIIITHKSFHHILGCFYNEFLLWYSLLPEENKWHFVTLTWQENQSRWPATFMSVAELQLMCWNEQWQRLWWESFTIAKCATASYHSVSLLATR